MLKLFTFLKSVKFTLIILALIAFFCGLATFIPQDRPLKFYEMTYSPLLSSFILKLHFHTFFRSAFFMTLMGLFSLNLLLSTITKILSRIKAKNIRELGPDIIYISILMLIAGGFTNILFRQENISMLQEGKHISIEKKYKIVNNSFTYKQYKDGRPKAWISNISVFYKGKEIERADIEVNRPLRFGSYSIYQSSYKILKEATLVKEDKKEKTIKPNRIFTADGNQYYLTSKGDKNSAHFKMKGKNNSSVDIEVKEGEKLGTYQLKKLKSINYSGLLIVKEPAYYFNFAAFIIFFLGLILAFYQKQGDSKK